MNNGRFIMFYSTKHNYSAQLQEFTQRMTQFIFY